VGQLRCGGNFGKREKVGRWERQRPRWRRMRGQRADVCDVSLARHPLADEDVGAPRGTAARRALCFVRCSDCVAVLGAWWSLGCRCGFFMLSSQGTKHKAPGTRRRRTSHATALGRFPGEPGKPNGVVVEGWGRGSLDPGRFSGRSRMRRGRCAWWARRRVASGVPGFKLF
jgi:hypothetical protein